MFSAAMQDIETNENCEREREKERENIHLFSCIEKRKNLSFNFVVVASSSKENGGASRRASQRAAVEFQTIQTRSIHFVQALNLFEILMNIAAREWKTLRKELQSTTL